ncbi:hypothetical protein [Rhodanobacter sp. DHG33]|uniref:hypothetical protein n=1 Tax=Rhodanobacter sp. DHG33 TaxID=2775921 RepID=UPI00178106C3|nr:hypothetical protein [Rhodanobacter sp. DHG33]MBD8899998.1 hypothetical protein [Rhodanobacter sp. DHG33]
MSKTMSRSTGRSAALAIGLSVAGTLLSLPVAAQVIVHDPGSMTSSHADSALSYAKQALQYAQQVQQYATQVQQYEQMLTKVMNLGTNFSILPNTMQPIDADSLIQANCNSSAGSIVGNLLNSVTSLINQSSITRNQQLICAAIINTQVDKYNRTVEMMNQLDSNIPAVQKFTSLANTFSNLGESSSATTQINSYSAQLADAMSQWKTQMDADDAYISSLQSMQSTLGQTALKAKPDLIGQAVQATALTAAFSYQPSL